MVRRRQSHRRLGCAYLLAALTLLAGCSTASLSLPGGGGGAFGRVLTDAAVTYERSADGAERWVYTSSPNAMTSEVLALARTLAAVVARTTPPLPAVPEKLMAPGP